MEQVLETPRIDEVIRVMNNHFGTALIEEMTGASHLTLLGWLQGDRPDAGQEAKLRSGYLVLLMLSEVEESPMAARVFLGMSPHLGDTSMFEAIRDGRRRDAIAAANAHING